MERKQAASGKFIAPRFMGLVEVGRLQSMNFESRLTL